VSGKSNLERGTTISRINANIWVRSGRLLAMALVVVVIAQLGCKSKQDQALDQAGKQASATGQAQQIVSVDKNGTTTTTVVQPPATGQKTETITTTTIPPATGASVRASSGPTVSAVPQPPKPTTVTIPAGTTLTIRIDQHLSVKNNSAGDRFTGEVVTPVMAGDNSVLVPKRSPVGGVVDVSHRRGHFKGRSFLELRLTSLTVNGLHYSLATRDLVRSKKGKGRRSAALIGGGAGLGMLVGGLASGGTGLVVGGLVGGGAGTAVSGLTGNRDIEIPAESIVRFRLANDLIVQLTR
jgi:hypothetical protein